MAPAVLIIQLVEAILVVGRVWSDHAINLFCYIH